MRQARTTLERGGLDRQRNLENRSIVRPWRANGAGRSLSRQIRQGAAAGRGLTGSELVSDLGERYSGSAASAPGVLECDRTERNVGG